MSKMNESLQPPIAAQTLVRPIRQRAVIQKSRLQERQLLAAFCRCRVCFEQVYQQEDIRSGDR